MIKLKKNTAMHKRLKGVFAKNERGIGLMRIKALLIATNFDFYQLRL